MNIEEIPDKDRVKNKRYLIKFLGIAAMNDELDAIEKKLDLLADKWNSKFRVEQYHRADGTTKGGLVVKLNKKK